MNINLLEKRDWDFSQTSNLTQIGSTNIALNGAPIFLTDISVVDFPPAADFNYTINSDCAPFTVSFFDNSSNNPTAWSWTFPGGTPGVSNLQNPVIAYTNPGNYGATLSVSNDFGNNSVSQSFDLGTDLVFELNSQLCFGNQIIVNGTVYNESNPSGTEIILGGGVNGCDSTIIVNLSFDNILESETTESICNGDTYLFGGELLSTAGTYTFETSTSNGCDSIATLFLMVEIAETFNFEVELCEGDEYQGVVYEQDATLTEIINSSNGCDSIINITDIYVKPTFLQRSK